MSSRGMTQAQLEARRRELERQREQARQQRVKNQVMELIQTLEKEQINLESPKAFAFFSSPGARRRTTRINSKIKCVEQVNTKSMYRAGNRLIKAPIYFSVSTAIR